MLTPPARILWYVSGKKGSVVAVSRLDAVKLGKPKVLFKEFKDLGILKWQHLYKMCGGDADTELMALLFSHTFSFRTPVPLEALRQTFTADGIGVGAAIAAADAGEYFLEALSVGLFEMCMTKRALLLSLKPLYADLVFQGLKVAELRRRISCVEDSEVFIYVSSPVRALRGGFRVGRVWKGPPEEVWDEVSDLAAVDKRDFDHYYAGRKVACALEIADVWEDSAPLHLDALRLRFSKFVVPQSWRYTTAAEYQYLNEVKKRARMAGPQTMTRLRDNLSVTVR